MCFQWRIRCQLICTTYPFPHFSKISMLALLSKNANYSIVKHIDTLKRLNANRKYVESLTSIKHCTLNYKQNVILRVITCSRFPQCFRSHFSTTTCYFKLQYSFHGNTREDPSSAQQSTVFSMHVVLNGVYVLSFFIVNYSINLPAEYVEWLYIQHMSID